MFGKTIPSIQKRQITEYAYKVAKGMMPNISVGFNRSIFSGNPASDDLKKNSAKASPKKHYCLDKKMYELCEVSDRNTWKEQVSGLVDTADFTDTTKDTMSAAFCHANEVPTCAVNVSSIEVDPEPGEDPQCTNEMKVVAKLLHRLVSEGFQMKQQLFQLDADLSTLKTKALDVEGGLREFRIKIFEGDLNGWVRDTVVEDSLEYDTFEGELIEIDPDATTNIGRYLSTASVFANYGVPGYGGQGLIKNFKLTETHVQKYLGFNLTSMYRAINACNAMAHDHGVPRMRTNKELCVVLEEFLLKSDRDGYIEMMASDPRRAEVAKHQLHLLHKHLKWRQKLARQEEEEEMRYWSKRRK